ncbi:hypothetical protein EGJ54_10705 [Pandoraea apista]|nr:hypothetical protein EGJ54_10705 [Pandoraea apista]RRX02176.1 hypothetical protein EGJ56_14675 [Pandoraea apista]
MMRVNVESISQGIYKDIPSEDVVGYLQRERSILAWAIDGASTLTESPFTTFDYISDAGWFARRLADLLRQLETTAFRKSNFHDGLDRLRQEYCAMSKHIPPLENWPVAAATIVETDFSVGTTLTVSIYRYADCFDLVHQGALPHSKREKPSVPQCLSYDAWKPCSGFEGQPLEQLLQRRRQQQRNEFSTALTLNPKSALNAAEEHLTIHTPAHILLGTDGLSRIWETYNLIPREQAIELVARSGLSTLLNILRNHEATIPAGETSGKRRDDASGIYVSLL